MSHSARSAPRSAHRGVASFAAIGALVAVGLLPSPSVAAASATTSPSTGAHLSVGEEGRAPSGVATLATGLTTPWGISFLANGQSALVTERNTAKVWQVARDGSKKRVGTVPHTVNRREAEDKGGLLGVAVSPGWNGTTDKDVFFVQSTSTDNRVVRMRFDGVSLSGYTPIVTGIERDTQHNGGAVVFGPDGYLYISTGDAFQKALAQNKNSLNGKILRVTRTGAPAPGNPFGTRVYSYGHRNPQGLAWDRYGRLWEAEIGEHKFDELNLIKRGANYGWPTCEGVCGAAGMTNPKGVWKPAEGVPSQITIADDTIYVSMLKGKLRRVPINGDSESAGPGTSYDVGYGRMRAIARVPGTNELWLGTSDHGPGNDRILKVTF